MYTLSHYPVDEGNTLEQQRLKDFRESLNNLLPSEATKKIFEYDSRKAARKADSCGEDQEEQAYQFKLGFSNMDWVLVVPNSIRGQTTWPRNATIEIDFPKEHKKVFDWILRKLQDTSMNVMNVSFFEEVADNEDMTDNWLRSCYVEFYLDREETGKVVQDLLFLIAEELMKNWVLPEEPRWMVNDGYIADHHPNSLRNLPVWTDTIEPRMQSTQEMRKDAVIRSNISDDVVLIIDNISNGSKNPKRIPYDKKK